MSQEAWDRLERHAQQVALRAIDLYVAESSLYQAPAPDHLYRHMAVGVRDAVHLFAKVGRAGRAPSAEELDGVRARARDRGAEGLPAADYVAAIFCTGRAIWEALTDADHHDLSTKATLLLNFLERLTGEAVTTHQEVFQGEHGDLPAVMHAVVSQLAAGESSPEQASRLPFPLASSYSLLSLSCSTETSELVDDPLGQRVAGRRKVTLLSEHLRRELRGDLLLALEPAGGLVMLPSSHDRAPADLAAVRTATVRLARKLPFDIRVGFSHARTRAELPAAAAEARRLAEMTRTPGEVLTVADEPFAYHVGQVTAATPILQRLRAGLEADPDLTETIRAYIDCHFKRGRAAELLHVHPNTVDNRLARIEQLTGVDPRTGRGLVLLATAVEVPPSPGPAM